MRALITCTFALALLPLAGCGGGDFPTAKVTGTVLCEGKPVSGIHVFFEPLQTGTDGLVGKQGIGQTDADGTFEITTYKDGDGAVVGKHRVRVGWSDRADSSSCPCEVDSEKDLMQVEVKKGETNEFELVLPEPKGKRRPTLDELEALEEGED